MTKKYIVGDTNFVQNCHGLEIYHTVALEDGNILLTGTTPGAKEIAKQINSQIGSAMLKLGKDLVNEVLKGK